MIIKIHKKTVSIRRLVKMIEAAAEEFLIADVYLYTKEHTLYSYITNVDCEDWLADYLYSEFNNDDYLRGYLIDYLKRGFNEDEDAFVTVKVVEDHGCKGRIEVRM